MAQRKTLSDYEKLLGGLEGDAFEFEVCARLQCLISDFQRIPRKPRGDGGLDGLSHGQERGYCCYGPEQNPVKLKTKGGLKDDIVEKFNADLRKLFELRLEANRRPVNEPNDELSTIIGEGNRVKCIYLVASWFETHRVIGPLNTAFNRYKRASDLRYIDPAATLTIWGPKDLSTLGELDEQTLFRVENRALFERLQTATTSSLPASSLADFDAKFAYLKEKRPDRAALIDELAADFRSAWATAIALDNELSSTSLVLHEELEAARTDAARLARLRSMETDEPYKLIEAMGQNVVERLGQSFTNRIGGLTARVADGVVAGLIGECPIEWRDNGG
jgi:hypothetical protein